MEDINLWLPDPELCTAQEELRRIEEWKRKNGKGTKRPSELGITNYVYGNPLPSQFYEGRRPPPVPMDSAENLEWYQEQLRRSWYGYECCGIRITGDHYWFLNFTPFLVFKKRKDGTLTKDMDIDFASFAYIQDYVFKLIEEAHETGRGFMMMGGRGYGKQQPDSEAVMTPSGPVPMGSIRPGDRVIGSDGKPIKVLQIHPQGIDDVYQLTLKDGRKIRCGLEHLWTVYDVKGRKMTLELKDMLSSYKKEYENGDVYYQYFIPNAKAVEYETANLPVHPYTLGALLGDGSFDEYGVRLGIAKEDREILQHILELEGWSDDDIGIHERKKRKSYHKSFLRVFFKKSTGLLKNIKSIGLHVTKTFDKFIPKQYLYGSVAQRLALLQGLMDTDGYISKSGRIEFYNKSKQLAEDVMYLARSLGIKTSLGLDSREEKIGYRVRLYTGEDVFFLSRKAARLNKNPNKRVQNHRDRTAIVNIEKLDYKEPSTCLTVDAKDNLYLTTDYTVTHNTYMILSILAKYYYLKPESHNVISASHSGHADEAFAKMLRMLQAIESIHPTLALARLKDRNDEVMSGYETTIDGVKQQRGPMSRIEKVIYGDNPGVTRGSRPDTFLMEEIGDWRGGKGNLKECYAASLGSWRIGSQFKTRLFMIGTGGSVTSDQAKDIFTKPEAYNLLAVDDFALKAGKKHAIFIPSHYLFGGAGWERTGVNNNEWAREFLEKERELKKDDPELYNKFVSEFPFTVEEVFKKSGTNIFHQRNIGKQWMDIIQGADHIITPEKGFLEWKRSKSGKIVGVEWAANPNGNVEIVEHPYRGKNGKTVFTDLYVAGIDSIDQGQLDSTSNKDRSSLAMLVKKRVVDGEYFNQTSNLYVAKYIGRSLDVRDDYEEALKLAMYYNAKVNVEYTKIGIVQYFRERKQWHLFMKRPAIAKSNAGSHDSIFLQRVREQNLIGTTTTPTVIDYGDGKIKEYTRDFAHQIFFSDLLEQLRDYQREDRTKYDLVIAMALCEIADEDMLGEPGKPQGLDTDEFQEFGYYIDEYGRKKFGTIPAARRRVEDYLVESKTNGFRWVDMTGRPRFDDKFDVVDARDL